MLGVDAYLYAFINSIVWFDLGVLRRFSGLVFGFRLMLFVLPDVVQGIYT